jgi:GDP-4-dehydro-6-deoxy-D-mannose reductase
MAYRVLITGATGFLGRAVYDHIRTACPDADLWATSNKQAGPSIRADKFRQIDLCDKEAVDEFVSICKPTHVIHLAGLVGEASLAEHLRVNVLCTENLYNSLTNTVNAEEVRAVQASTAAIYGLVGKDELPITEDQPPRPVTAYALSKLSQEHLAMAMWRTQGLQVICARIFNMLGPGQAEGLVPMTFLSQLTQVKAGRASKIKVGNLASRRDFIDVTDVALAFDVLMKHGRPGEAYNVASGNDVSIKKVLDMLLQISGQQPVLEVADERIRRADVPLIRADISKIVAETNWRPTITLFESLKIMWESTAFDSPG